MWWYVAFSLKEAHPHPSPPLEGEGENIPLAEAFV
jgi:hypothetical protein